MPRYELSDGSSNKFWEIEQAGKSVTVKFGKIGAAGQTQIKKLKNEAEAKAQVAKLVAEKTKKGYQLAGGKAKPAKAKGPAAVVAREPKLEAAIAAAPDDPDAYLVYADWLQSQGDPRGTLIVLQHQKKKAAANKLLEQHPEHFWGPVAEYTDCLERFPYEPLGRSTEWRWGYLESIWISNKRDRDRMYGEGKPEIDVETVLGTLLDHPSARFVRELTVGILSYDGNTYQPMAKVLGKRTLPTLRKLILGDFYYEETELNWSKAGNLSPLYQAVPNLESLTVRSGSMKLGAIDLPKLRELVIISGGLDSGSLASICNAKWPRLERLSVQLGEGIKAKHAQPILDGKAFPKVTHLGLGNSEVTDELCKGLASSRIAAQLESLDLSLGTMGDDGAAALVAGRFPKLKSIDVSRSYLSKKAIASLKKIAKQVVADRQNEDDSDPDDRYISGYE
jgi:uncharacterized protein (TIGR02996 family)